ncbi:Na+/H+ antiporter subunit G [Corynebacterium sp. ES2775-CONJ]|uniref:Na+/H+ antiporter subunit G n=1 Tax=Corynebacterium sp. ES2775-CONJ TaxID=2974029 RepID=UPI002169B259|nr:Na+/H+ antiporter subunit G [Corynebacterium sp. ES2775-CONJ]MCS4490341.1 Na+/H+ antiporter subunit G [Corynebacterium sp. ES2775-CONJ]
MIIETIAGILVLISGLLMFITAVALWRKRYDPMTAANLFSTGINIGLPLLIIAKLMVNFYREGFVFGDLVRGILAIIAILVVVAVGSFIMGRSLYQTATEDS